MGIPKKAGKKVDDRHLRLEYMGGRCTICRRGYKSIERQYLTSKGVFEFNHIDPGRKSPIYEKLIRRVISPEQLDELDKCNLLCRICHGIWTNQRLKGTIKPTIILPDGRIVTRRINLHGLIEFKDRKPIIHAFADESINIDIYAYRLGKGRTRYRLGFELAKNLVRLLIATRRSRTLQIWDKQGLVFKAGRLDADRLRVEYSVRMPIFKFEVKPEDPRDPSIMVRKGKVLIRGRRIRSTGVVSFVALYEELGRAVAKKAPHPPH